MRGIASHRVALGYLLLSLLFLTGMEIAAKRLTVVYPVWQVVWAKYFFHLLGVPALLGALGKWHDACRSTRAGLQLLRSALLFGATATFFFALKSIPLVVANTIGFLTPIFTVLLARIILNERLGAIRIVAVTFGFVGVLVVMRPTSVDFSAALLLPAATALCYSLYTLATRSLSSEVSPYAILLWTPVVGSIGGTLAAYSEFRSPDFFGWMELLALGTASLFGHLFAIKAYAAAPASRLAPFTYLQLPLALSLGFLVFGFMPDGWTIFGAAVIVVAGLFAAFGETDDRKSKRILVET